MMGGLVHSNRQVPQTPLYARFGLPVHMAATSLADGKPFPVGLSNRFKPCKKFLSLYDNPRFVLLRKVRVGSSTLHQGEDISISSLDHKTKECRWLSRYFDGPYEPIAFELHHLSRISTSCELEWQSLRTLA